jgi:HK97 family phage major capsid protein
MTISQIQKLQEERKKAWDRGQEISARADSEEGLTAEDRTNWDAALERVDTLSSDIERLERDAKHGSIDYGQIITAPAGGTEERSGAGGEEKTQEQRYEEAFGVMLRRGQEGLSQTQRDMMMANFSAGESRAQSTTTTAGGYLIPPGFLIRMTETLKAFGGILNAAEIINTDSGNPLQWPTFNGTAQAGQILAENATETALDMAFGSTTLGAYTYSSRIVQVSLQLMQDSAFNLDDFVARQLGIRIGRAIAPHLATGTGTSQPTGLFTNATIGKTGLVGQTTSVIYDDLIDLIHSIDPAYRAMDGCQFVLADSSLKAVRKLKDSQGHPLWEPSVQVGTPSTLLGYAYTVDQGVPAMAANAKSIGFGNVHAGYVVRQVSGGQLLRLTERYADSLQVGYLGFLRLDGKPNDAAAFAVYANSAT